MELVADLFSAAVFLNLNEGHSSFVCNKSVILDPMRTNEIIVSIQAIILSSETCYLRPFCCVVSISTVESVYPVLDYLGLYLLISEVDLL